MPQLTLAATVSPAQEDRLVARLRGTAAQELDGLAPLHFLSMFVIPAQGQNPPLLCLEANFDHSPDAFLAVLMDDARSRRIVEGAFRMCEGCPAANAGNAEWVAYFQSCSIEPCAFYVGSPGRDVLQIQDEARFAQTVERIALGFGAPRGRRAEVVRGIWDALPSADRDFAMRVPKRPFLVRWQPHRRPLGAILDIVRWPLFAIGIATIVLVAAQAAGSPVWPAVAPPLNVVEATGCWTRALLWFAGLAAVLWTWQFAHEFPAGLTRSTALLVTLTKVGEFLRVTLRALPGFAALLGVIAFVYWHKPLLACIGVALLLAIVAFALLLGAIWLTRVVQISLREPDDSVAPPTWDLGRLAEVIRAENDGPQTHFVSVTQVRPGCLRYLTLKSVLCWIGTLATIFYNPRGLFDSQSIHFARWALLPGRRLLFVSNYDGSFGGYLSVFATLGAAGVSAIWGNTVDFPRTFLLFGDGARDEQRFKARARASQIETLLWFRRYPELSVAAIERNAAIREDLARFARTRVGDGERLSEAELDTFLQRLAYRV